MNEVCVFFLVFFFCSAAMSRSGNSHPDEAPGTRPTPLEDIASEPSVVEDRHKWTVFNSQVNLPAVLNDPRLSRRETDFFTKTWGESFEKTTVHPSSHIPEITRNHFKKYLKRTSGVRETLLSPDPNIDIADFSDAHGESTGIIFEDARQHSHRRHSCLYI